MSQKGYDNLITELTQLESIECPRASAAIAETRDKGGLSGNSEYNVTKETQTHLGDKISKMKPTIVEAKIVDVPRLSADTVQILSRAEMTDMKTKSKMVYTTVSGSEADLKTGKISIKTPITQGLLNKKEDDEMDIKIPADTIKLRIDKTTVE